MDALPISNPETDNQEAEVLSADCQAAAKVRELHDDPDRDVIFITTVANPFGSAEQNIDIYADNRDYEYWIAADAGRLIQAGPRAGLHQAPHQAGPLEKLPVAELRRQAIAVADRQRPGFSDQLSSFHPFEENRRGALYLFRWESGSTESDEIPPFIQVGLFADGEVACFTDAL